MVHDWIDVHRPVLVVEDNQDDFDTVVQAASRAHVYNRMVHAADADAAQRILANEPGGTFALMLLDHNLPGQDGLTFLRCIRGDPLLAKLPTVIYTTSGNPRDRDAFYDAGANAYHVKEVQYGACLRTLEDIFQYWLNRVALPGVSTDPFRARRLV